MRPLAEIWDVAKEPLCGLFMDIDDTITNGGKLLPVAYEALYRAHEAGLLVIPITGRPAGWCDQIARFWPVDGVVGENGALYFRMVSGKLLKRYMLDEASRLVNRTRLEDLGREILAGVPGTALASDQPYREFDLAIDYREDVPPVPSEGVDRIVEIARARGATVKVSSIHVNIWFGTNDKLTMCKAMLAEQFGVDLDARRGQYVFCGDSPNDEPMFAFFPLSVGVANVRHLLHRMTHTPALVTQGEGGYGFAEVVDALLAGRPRAGEEG
jgi:HAD superfamily hydrolase (TIGR01484 family)